MFKKLFAFLEEGVEEVARHAHGDEEARVESEDDAQPTSEDRIKNDENDEEKQGEMLPFGIKDDRDMEGVAQGTPQHLTFLSVIKEKQRINKATFDDYKEELHEFKKNASEKRVEVKMELEDDFVVFFKDANKIVKQTRDMEEARTLERLGLEEADMFTGKFSFDDVKRGKQTMDEVSHIFRPRRQLTGKHFREDGDDVDACCQLLTGAHEPPVNYDPLSDWEFNHWQKHYIGLAKIFDRHLESEETILELSEAWLGDVIAMKLLAEFIWRNPDMITGVNAASAKGFQKKNCLMVMQALKECTGLIGLNFDNAHLCPEGSAALALITKLSDNIESVTLVNSNTQDAGACFWGLALASGCPKLQTLDISNAKITATGATAIAIGLSKHQCLRTLNLSHNFVNREGCQRLGEALLVNPILEELILDSSAIGSRGASSLAAFLIHPKCKLKILDLSNNDIGRRGGKALAVAMSLNKSLIKLNLASNDLGDIGVAGFGLALERNSCLKDLSIADCDITDIGAAAFAIGLASNSTLRILDMSNQVIADAGCAEIARNIGKNEGGCKLKKLDLSSNAVRDIGAQGLAAMLKLNTSIAELKLNDNEIGNDGAIALGKVLADKDNHSLKTLDMSDNPIAAQVSIEWFAKAERRLVTQYTQRLDVVAEGTALARGNLRGCGVIVMRSEIFKWYAIFSGTASLVGGWFNMASDIIVARNTVLQAIESPAGHAIYAFLTVAFVVVPYTYVLVVFSLPADETDVTTRDVHGKLSVHHLAPQSSSLMLGRMTMSTTSGAKSFREHMAKVTSSKCDEERVKLFFINACVVRVPYEVYLGFKAGITTLAYSSIRLAQTIFGSIPQSMTQIHILMSTANLERLQQPGGILNGGIQSMLFLFVSISLSISVLSITLSGLFEEKFVVNWKRVALSNEELAYWLGFFAAYFYHASHYLLRALTITLLASIYAPLLAAGFFAFGIALRLVLHKCTKSERTRSFAVISYLVGVASWDKKLASRLAVLFETLETFIVIGPLWLPRDTILFHLDNAPPMVFQRNWLSLVDYVGPVFFTALLYSCWGLSFLLYVGFIERIHPYSDVSHTVDLNAAEALAKEPFDELNEQQKAMRAQKLQFNGHHMLHSMGSSMRSSAKMASHFLSGFPFRSRAASAQKGRRTSKKKEADPAIQAIAEQENEDEQDNPA